MMLLYNLLWPLGLLLFLPGFLLKMFRRGGYRKNFGQRLGLYTREVREHLARQPRIWIHAVSVGEVMIALKLAGELHRRKPDMHCALTTTTTTAHALAERSAPPWMMVLYTPLDFWPIMRRAFRAIAPRQIILVEAEVWPNLVTQAARANIPVALANARLSPRSERKFLRFKFLLAPIFQKLSLLCVPTAEEATRWRRLGAPADKIEILGNIKYDVTELHHFSSEPRQFLDEIGIDSTRPVLFGGSTHRGEEEILADALIELRKNFPALFLVIAPRHAERTGDVKSLLRRKSLRVTRRTSAREAAPDALLIDTTGELAQWYSIATVVFVGKSMTARGGQNPVEAIVAGKPVIIGPSMENFAAITRQLLEADAVLCAHDRDEFIVQARLLLSEPARRELMVRNAHNVLASHRGATARTAELMASLSYDG